MTDPAVEINAAERRASDARARLTGTLGKLQARLKPKVLARDAARSAADAGQHAALAGLDVAKANPAPVAGVVAAVGLFLARRRLFSLFRRRSRGAKPAHQEDSR